MKEGRRKNKNGEIGYTWSVNELGREECGVRLTLGHQLRVGAHFHNLALLQDNDTKDSMHHTGGDTRTLNMAGQRGSLRDR